MGESLERHRPLLLKHARAYARGRSDSVSAEDIARELELVFHTWKEQGRLDFETLPSPDATVRAILEHTARRATRRGTLLQQVAAGDDLRAVASDLAAIDADLPDVPDVENDRARVARDRVDAVKGELPARDRLLLALLLEDGASDADAAAAVGAHVADVEEARRRIVRAAARHRLIAYDEARPAPLRAEAAHEDILQENRLDVLARIGGARSQEDDHVAEPVLALVRHGDHGDDLEDALFHLASCAACRALLTETVCARRSLVVVAIEGPHSSQRALHAAAGGVGARLLERGQGRWAAVVDAERADSLKDEIGKSRASQETRVVLGKPVDVPLERSDSFPRLETGEPFATRAPSGSRERVTAGAAGMLSAEISAWAEVPKAPLATKKPAWTFAALAALVAALAIAYVFVSAR